MENVCLRFSLWSRDRVNAVSGSCFIKVNPQGSASVHTPSSGVQKNETKYSESDLMFDRRQNLGLGEIEEKEEGGIRGSGCVLMHTILTLFLSDFTTVELSNNRSKLTMG